MFDFVDPSMTDLFTHALPNAPYWIAAFAVAWFLLVLGSVYVMFRMIALDKEVQALQDSIDAKLTDLKKDN
ncbi:MAG: hypothetical protein FWC86_01165 [Coriobacteriia bacterium]|nr:hypothetical protein [Coriobacteriia bacterium]